MMIVCGCGTTFSRILSITIAMQDAKKNKSFRRIRYFKIFLQNIECHDILNKLEKGRLAESVLTFVTARFSDSSFFELFYF